MKTYRNLYAGDQKNSGCRDRKTNPKTENPPSSVSKTHPESRGESISKSTLKTNSKVAFASALNLAREPARNGVMKSMCAAPAGSVSHNARSAQRILVGFLESQLFLGGALLSKIISWAIMARRPIKILSSRCAKQVCYYEYGE